MKNIFFLLLLLPAIGNAQIITTIAGTNIAGYSGNGGPATNAMIYHPNQITVDGAGNVYIAESDNHVVRKISTSGIISLVAGNGVGAYTGDGGPATDASINVPLAMRFDGVGNLYISTYGDNRIRKVDVSGTITTVAGNGVATFSGDGGPATAASFDGPFCMAFDSNGDMYIADISNNKIRKIDMATGIISTVAGTGAANYTGDGGPALTATFDGPIDLAFDKMGNMFVADINNSVIRKIDVGGTISTIVGNGSASFSGDGGPAASAALAYPYGLCLDTSDNIYISDNANSRIRKISKETGIIETVVGNGTSGYSGDGGPATAAQIFNVGGVVTNDAGDIFIAGFGNNVVRKVTMAPTNVHEASASIADVRISPNPATNSISLSSATTITTVQIIDPTGRQVGNYTPNTRATSIDISKLAPQVYLVRINNLVVKTFMKK